mmetsp:Transcript_56978/g.138811  ORF Transcript_56978/g.138811 Transcript_56978/m.138811 type:complete len:335 (+) Transcript_56978:1502-2506(+)
MTLLKIGSKSFRVLPLLVVPIVALQLSSSSTTITNNVLAWTSSPSHQLLLQQRYHRRSSSPSASLSSSSSRSMLPLFDSDNIFRDISDDDCDAEHANHLVNAGSTRRTFLSSSGCSALAIAAASIMSTPRPAGASYIDPKQDTPSITKRVYLDVESTGNGSGKGLGSFKGRITIGLFGDVTPKLVDNFVSLCQSNAYAGTTFYRVLSDMSIQGGAIGDPTGRSGKSAATLVATKDDDDSNTNDATALFPDNYNIQHTMTGLVSMVNGAGGTIDSRFFINVNDNGGWGDDRYAAFGILEGDESFDIMRKIERVKVKPPSNKPADEIMIVKSGVVS